MGHVWKCCTDGFFPEVLGRGKAEKPRIVSLLEEIPPLWQVRVGIFRSQGAFLEPLNQWSSTFLAAGTGFAEDNFTMDWDGFRTIQARYIIVHFIFFLLLHQLRLRSSTIKSQMLGTAAIHHLTGGCCPSFCICQALHALKRHWGSHLLVIRILPLKKQKASPRCISILYLVLGSGNQRSQPHLQVKDATAIYPKPANPECLIIQHLTAACFLQQEENLGKAISF